jgi:hypothetical protein
MIFKILDLSVSFAALVFSANALRFEHEHFKLSSWDWIRFLTPIGLACFSLSMSCLSFTHANI